MTRTLLLGLALLASCAGPDPAATRNAPASPAPAADEAPPPVIDSDADPLMAAMALLKAAKDAPRDTAAARRAATAFLVLEREARERGDADTADRYHQVAADLDPLAAEGEAAAPAAPPQGPALDSVVAGGVPAQSEAMEKESPLSGLRLGTFHFSVKISGSHAARSAEEVIGVLEEAYLKVCGAMAANPDGKIPVVLYTDREFREETGLPGWVGGAYDGTIHLPLDGLDASDPRARSVIVHEFVHAFNHQVAKGRCPLWLDEGLAQYFEEPRRAIDAGALVQAARGGGLPPITSPSFLSGGRETATVLYQMALAAVLYLEDRASLAAVSAFLQAVGSGPPAPQAFQETFLFPYDRLQGDLLQWLERKNR